MGINLKQLKKCKKERGLAAVGSWKGHRLIWTFRPTKAAAAAGEFKEEPERQTRAISKPSTSSQ